MTGSFHPISDQLWDKEAYIESSQGWIVKACDAAFRGDSVTLEQLLSTSFSGEMNSVDINGWTPLMYACAYGHLEAAKVLLDRRVDLNTR